MITAFEGSSKEFGLAGIYLISTWEILPIDTVRTRGRIWLINGLKDRA